MHRPLGIGNLHQLHHTGVQRVVKFPVAGEFCLQRRPHACDQVGEQNRQLPWDVKHPLAGICVKVQGLRLFPMG